MKGVWVEYVVCVGDDGRRSAQFTDIGLVCFSFFDQLF
jgi:hypothetical protein